MVSIEIDGFTVDIPSGTPLPVEMVNPHLLYSDIVGRSVKLPALPLTPINRKVFGYYEQPQTGNALQRRTITQYYNGQLIAEAIFLITEAGPNGYVGSLVDNLNEFFGDAQKKLLTELNLGSLTLPGTLTPVVTDSGRNAYAFPLVVNPDFYGTNGSTISYSGKVNDYAAGAYTSAVPKVPMPFLTYFFYKLGQLTGTTITGDFLAHAQYSQLLLYSTRALDGATSATLARYLPEMSIPQFFIELRKLFNLRYDFNVVEKTLKIGFWDTAFSAVTVLDWSKKAVGRPTKIPETNTRLQLGYQLDGGDGLMKDKPSDLADYLTAGTDPGIASLTSQFSTLLTDTTTGTLKASQIGITSQFGQLNQTFGPRLCFWKGVVSGVPAASNTLTGYSLFWNGASGLAAHHWSNTEANRQKQFYAKQQLLLNETDLATLDWSKKVHINGLDYLIASLTGELPITKPFQALLVRV